eukprot:511775-Pleurochrysis_carterae.AAC.2
MGRFDRQAEVEAASAAHATASAEVEALRAALGDTQAALDTARAQVTLAAGGACTYGPNKSIWRGQLLSWGCGRGWGALWKRHTRGSDLAGQPGCPHTAAKDVPGAALQGCCNSDASRLLSVAVRPDSCSHAASMLHPAHAASNESAAPSPLADARCLDPPRAHPVHMQHAAEAAAAATAVSEAQSARAEAGAAAARARESEQAALQRMAQAGWPLLLARQSLLCMGYLPTLFVAVCHAS